MPKEEHRYMQRGLRKQNNDEQSCGSSEIQMRVRHGATKKAHTTQRKNEKERDSDPVQCSTAAATKQTKRPTAKTAQDTTGDGLVSDLTKLNVKAVGIIQWPRPLLSLEHTYDTREDLAQLTRIITEIRLFGEPYLLKSSQIQQNLPPVKEKKKKRKSVMN